MIQDIKTAILNEFYKINTANGYSNTIKTVYGKYKSAKDINVTEMPAISVFSTVVTPEKFDEKELCANVHYTILIYAEKENDINEDGIAESNIVNLYLDILKLLEDETSLFNNNGNILDWEIGNLFLSFDSSPSYGITTIKLKIN